MHAQNVGSEAKWFYRGKRKHSTAPQKKKERKKAEAEKVIWARMAFKLWVFGGHLCILIS